MPFGIQNVTAVNMTTIEQLSNFTEFPEFLINVNHVIYGGILYFVLLWVMWIILFMALQQRKPQLLNNLLYSGAVVSVVSFFIRAIEITQQGVVRGLLTDYQMWIFPIITISIAAIVWATK